MDKRKKEVVKKELLLRKGVLKSLWLREGSAL